MLNINKIRSQFPILKTGITYLDSAASTLTPLRVINKLNEVYTEYPVNIGRGQYGVANRATREFEEARKTIASFINAEPDEVILTSGATMSANIVGLWIKQYAWHDMNIVISPLEHNSFYYPIKFACSQEGTEIRSIPITKYGNIDYDNIQELIDDKTWCICVSTANNITGEVTDIKRLVKYAEAHNAYICLDVSQCLGHQKIDVKSLGVDFIFGSFHKAYGAYGSGFIWAKKEWLESETPALTGSGMMLTGQDKIANPPAKWEQGTPAITEHIASAEAIRWIQSIGIDNIAQHESELTKYAIGRLSEIEGVEILGGTDIARCPVISFVIDGYNPYDFVELLDNQGVCCRIGKLCNEAVVREFNQEAVIRISFAVYNTFADIDHFIKALKKSIEMLKKKPSN